MTKFQIAILIISQFFDLLCIMHARLVPYKWQEDYKLREIEWHRNNQVSQTATAKLVMTQSVEILCLIIIVLDIISSISKYVGVTTAYGNF